MISPSEAQEQAEKAAEAAHQLRISYGITFNGDHGQRVLADLKRRFGWNGNVERATARPGMRSEEVWLADGMKEPIRHILAQLEARPEEKPKLGAITS